MSDDEDASDEDANGEGADADRERDPFGRLAESVGDREGDPFEHLSDPDADEGVGTSPTATDESTDERAPSGPETGGDPGAVGDRTGAGDDGSAVEEVDEPRVRPGQPDVDASDPERRRGDPFDDADGPFQRMDVREIDEGQVWESLSAAQARGSVAESRKRTYADVSKHSFCERCEYFTGPPAVDCTHEGTEILEFVDAETVRVVDCPVVARRRALERGDDPKEI